MHVGHIVLVAAHGVAGLQAEAFLGCVSLDVLCLAVAGNEAAEVIVSLAISLLAEVYFALDDCEVVFGGHCLLVCHLNDYYALAVEHNLVVLANG